MYILHNVKQIHLFPLCADRDPQTLKAETLVSYNNKKSKPKISNLSLTQISLRQKMTLIIFAPHKVSQTHYFNTPDNLLSRCYTLQNQRLTIVVTFTPNLPDG